MRIPERLRLYWLAKAQELMATTHWDQELYTLAGKPYLQRWWLNDRRWRELTGNRYLHRILLSDDDRALHDHPWLNGSIILDGVYAEILGPPVVMGFDKFIPHRIGRPGDLLLRSGSTCHRLVVTPGRPVISIFFTGPKYREWGFKCPDGWRHHKIFTRRVNPKNPDDRRTVGCGEE